MKLEESRVACQAAYAHFHGTRDEYNQQLEELENIREQVSVAKHEKEDSDKLKVGERLANMSDKLVDFATSHLDDLDVAVIELAKALSKAKAAQEKKATEAVNEEVSTDASSDEAGDPSHDLFAPSRTILEAEAAGKKAAAVAEQNRLLNWQMEQKRRADVLWNMASANGEMAAGWQHHYDEQRQLFFFHNVELKATSWDYPARQPTVVVQEVISPTEQVAKASDKKDMEAKQETRKEAYKKAANAEEAKAQRSSNAEDIRKAQKEAMMEAKRNAGTVASEVQAQQSQADAIEIHSDSEEDQVDQEILRQERQFMSDGTSTEVPVGIANPNQMRQEQLFRQGMQQQSPSAACP